MIIIRSLLQTYVQSDARPSLDTRQKWLVTKGSELVGVLDFCSLSHLLDSQDLSAKLML
jgi:hypothetical protein